jgi:hypothetical protein
MAVDHEKNLEVPIIHRVCFACGYNEPVDVVDEDTPAHNKYCPECGSILHRLSGTEMFHLNFVDDPEKLPSGIEVVDDPKSQTKKFNYISKQAPIVKVHQDDIVTLKAEGHIWTYVGKSIRPRFMVEWKKDHIRAIHFLQLKSHLAYWNDNRLPERRGFFGISKGKNLVDKILRGKPLTLKEIHGHQVTIKSDNHHVLQVRVDDHILRFKPKKNFPLDNHLVSPSVFEDFVRRFKNLLREDSSRAVMFLISQGKMVQAFQNRDKYNISVLPESLRNFNVLSRVFNKRGVFWRGNYENMHVKGSIKHIESIVRKVDSGLSVFIEETVSGDINPGYVVGKDKKNRSKSLKWMKKFLTGNVEEIDSDGEVTFEWRSRLTDKNEQAFKKALGILGATSARVTKDEARHRFVAETHMTSVQMSPPRWEWVLEQDEIDNEVGMHLPEDVNPELSELLEAMYGVIQDLPGMWAESFGFTEDEFYTALDSVLEMFMEEVAAHEAETQESITEDGVLDILADMESWDKDAVSVLKTLNDVVGETDLPFYVTFYIMSDLFSAPLTEIESMYFDFIESSEPAPPIEPDNTDVDEEVDDDNIDVDETIDDDNKDIDIDTEDDDVTITVQVDNQKRRNYRKVTERRLTEMVIEDFLGNLGDVNWTEYGGDLVFGADHPELYHIEEPEMVYLDRYGEESETGHREWKVSSVDLDRFHMQDGKLVNEFDHEDWFTDQESLQSIASVVGSSVEDMIRLLTSEDWLEVALGYVNVAASHGWENFHSNPPSTAYAGMKAMFKGIPGIEDISKE